MEEYVRKRANELRTSFLTLVCDEKDTRALPKNLARIVQESSRKTRALSKNLARIVQDDTRIAQESRENRPRYTCVVQESPKKLWIDTCYSRETLHRGDIQRKGDGVNGYLLIRPY